MRSGPRARTVETSEDANRVSTHPVGEPTQRVNNMREQILRAAHRCLVQVGFERITTRRIADEAAVNVATLHYYFGPKEALLTAAVAFGTEQAERTLQEAVDVATDAPTALQMGIERTWELVREQPGILRYDVVVRGFRDETAHAEAVEIYGVYRRLTRGILDRHLAEGGTLSPGLTTESLAIYINSLIDGVIVQFTVLRDESLAKLSLSLILTHALQLMEIGNGRTADETTGF
jgi:AcrR family transcriptional regulator